MASIFGVRARYITIAAMESNPLTISESRAISDEPTGLPVSSFIPIQEAAATGSARISAGISLYADPRT